MFIENDGGRGSFKKELAPFAVMRCRKGEIMIYFDNSATTKIAPEALQSYVQTSERFWGNPSSLHRLGGVSFPHSILIANFDFLIASGAFHSCMRETTFFRLVWLGFFSNDWIDHYDIK